LKRFLAPLVLIAALAVPATALAGVKTYSGDATAGSVSMEVKTKKGKPKKVNEFTFFDIPLTCADGEDTVSGRYPAEGFSSSAKVKNKRFSISAGEINTGAGLEIAGKFQGKSSAEGTLEIAGDTSDHTDCVSGVIDWTATR